MESEDYEKRDLGKKASLTPVFKRLRSIHVLFHCNLSITFNHIRREFKLKIYQIKLTCIILVESV